MKHNLTRIVRRVLFILPLVYIFLCIGVTSVGAVAGDVGTSSTTGSTQPATMRQIVRTGDGTLHAFIQKGTQTVSCGGQSRNGLVWMYSTDDGSSWTCGAQLNSDTSVMRYASIAKDTSNNLYVIYTPAANAGSASYDLIYQKLTYTGPGSWTVGSAQTVLDSTSTSFGYTYATIHLEPSARLWFATRYYDGANYKIMVYYSDGFSDAPNWTQSTAALDTLGSNASYHFPHFIRFSNHMGVIYNDQSSALMKWRFRSDDDSLSTWSAESNVGGIAAATTARFSAAGDSLGNIYFATNQGTNILFSYWNGSVWSASATVSSAASSNLFASVATDETNVWVFYAETTGLSSGLSGNRKLVYKKGVFPFTAADFDTTSTPVVSYHTTFDKYWSYVSSAYTNDTTDAGNTTSADTQIVAASGSIAYFGKTEQFDAVAWDVSTNGTGGAVAWEYWNGSTWTSLSLTASTNPNFQGDGYGAFTPPGNWATTTVNGEGTPYYYIRARATTNYTASPVGVQMAAIPQINWADITQFVTDDAVYALWTENATAPTRVRETPVSLTASSANTSSTVNLTSLVGYSSTTLSIQPSTMRHIVRTSDGTLHAFIQAGTLLPCGASSGSANNLGLVWIYSTDSGSTWTCGGQLSSNTSTLYYASATVDSSDNVYVVYSAIANGGNATYQVNYRKLTKGSGSTWTLEAESLILDGGASTGYTYAVIEAQGTTRLWLAARYFDGTNYKVVAYYSNGLSASPDWTVSNSSLDSGGSTTTLHHPVLIRFATNIGIIYNDQTSSLMKWRFRADTSELTSWSNESNVGGLAAVAAATFSATADSSGNIYFAVNNAANILFSYWNGTVWSASATVSSAGASSAFVSVSTDGTNAWVFYGETTGLSTGLSGSRKLVYKKGTLPFTTTEFDTTSTPVVSYHTTFDKYWSYVSSAYTNDTADAGNTTSADTQMASGIGDIMYFGKTEKFDTIAWDVSTAGTGGQIVWEYWNGSSWVFITDILALSASTFTADGYITFIPNSDWATTQVNSESTPYYYVRARVTTAFSVSPVGVQMAAIPQINWGNVTGTVASDTMYAMWTENAGSPIRVREASVSVTASTPNNSSTVNLIPSVGYSSTTLSTQPSTMRHIVKTSDGTLHAFIQAGTVLPCSASSSSNNNLGLVWIYSTDSGSTWTCGGQLSSNTSTLYYASATVDSSDNVYVVYSVATNGGNALFDVYYRKFTKGVGASWTMEAEQTAVNATTASIGYSYADIAIEGASRLWIAMRYFDGTNYQIPVYYSDSLSAEPVWTQSIGALDTAGTSASDHYPTIFRFDTRIGVVYNAESPNNQRWRYRADNDELTEWEAEGTVSSSNLTTPTFSAVGDNSGNVYVAMNVGTTVIFNYWNTSSWSSNVTVSSAAASNLFVSIMTYNASIWVFYPETTGLSSALTGNRKFVYKKAVSPYGSGNFDTNATPVVSYHTTFDKYWSYVSSSYTNDTTDAGNTTNADTQMASGVGDVMYFGKTEKFDTIAWDVSTAGTGGQIVWEYWNGSAWVLLTDILALSAPTFTADGYMSFIPHSNWATTSVNGEGTPYYYVRARVTQAFSVTPVAVQLAAIPQINWGNVVGSTGALDMIWTQNATSPTIVKYTSVELPNIPDDPTSLGPSDVVNGESIHSDQPTFQFTLSDTNDDDEVQYRIQIDDTVTFSSPVVDYTSALQSQGATSFTVGQAAGSGTYTAGSVSQTLEENEYYWRVQATDETGLSSEYVAANLGSVAFKVDVTAPTNASSLSMLRSVSGTSVASGGWTKHPSPKFSWTAGGDTGGSNLKGYCLYLGASGSGDPASAKGLLGTSPVSTSGTNCQFIVSGTSIDFATSSYKGSPWLSTSSSLYYFSIKAVDNAGNTSASSQQFSFKYDDEAPTNVNFISPASGNFSNVVDMTFSWPNTSSDANAGVLGWQYQLNSSSGTWQGTSHAEDLDLDYIPATASAYTFVQSRDGDEIVTGANTIYFRTVDNAGNLSSDATIRTGSISYAGEAPTFGTTDGVTVTPSSSTTNSFELSWPAASPGSGHSIGAYYYMVNTTPPSTYSTLSGNSTAYVNNGTFRTVSSRALPNVNKGENTIYVVAVDNADTPNYSPSNYITGTFTLNSSDPDNVGNLVVSDASIKSQSAWNVALTWTAPSYVGAGNLTYLVYRSSDGTTFSQVGTTQSLTYVDSAPESALYYYKVYTKDGANSTSSGTNAVSITPTGKWISAPTLESDAEVSEITTKKAKITWSTSRTADSKVQFGTSSGNYNSEEPSNSNQVSTHTINLTNLTAGTTYYYRAKWTDEDGNTGISEEGSFTTAAAPYISNLKISNVSINSALITFTANNASQAVVQYGKTISYGGEKEVSTSTSESTYTVALTELTEGTVYHLRVVAQDSEANSYSGDDYTFETLPVPQITNLKVQQVVGMPTATFRLIWTSNTPISSIVTYYASGAPTSAKDQINLTLKKTHETIIKDLQDDADYIISVAGRDTAGNEATVIRRQVKTSNDIRAPEIQNLNVESTIVGVGEDAKVQVIVSWDTDEPSTTQVEYAQGTGAAYGQSTQEETNKTLNHVVTLTGLSPSKIYHLRAISKDKANNVGYSADTVVITPKSTKDALNLVINNLSKTFGFLKGMYEKK